ncbi:MAG: hypothetical protein GY940_30660, partial [bacterium]|nr:hypothetical protein [bacterium]
ILTLPLSKRAVEPGKMVKLFKNNGHSPTLLTRDNPADAYRAARQFKNEILITGSFYLVGTMRQMVMNTTRRV